MYLPMIITENATENLLMDGEWIFVAHTYTGRWVHTYANGQYVSSFRRPRRKQVRLLLKLWKTKLTRKLRRITPPEEGK